MWPVSLFFLKKKKKKKVYIYIYIYISSSTRAESIYFFKLLSLSVSIGYKKTETLLQAFWHDEWLMFANVLRDLGLIPVRIIPKTQKMLFDASLLNT